VSEIRGCPVSATLCVHATTGVDTAAASAVSPVDIRPYPKKERALTERRKRKKQQAEVLTSTPFKDMLAQKKSKQSKASEPRTKAKRKLLKSEDVPNGGKKSKRGSSKLLGVTEQD